LAHGCPLARGHDSLSASGAKVDPASAVTAAIPLQAASLMAGSAEFVDAARDARCVVEMALAQDAMVVPAAVQAGQKA